MRVYNLLIILFLLLATPPGATVRAGWTPDGSPVCIMPGDQGGILIVPDGRGGAIIAWHDNRNGNGDIYAQRIDSCGNLAWATGGVAVCTAPGNQKECALIPDGTGGAIAAWTDARDDAYGDIYAQRIGGNGNMLWTTDGVAIAIGPTDQLYPVLLPGGSRGAVIGWLNYDESAVPCEFGYYVQWIDGGGCIRWGPGGMHVYCGSAGWVVKPVAISDGAGGALYAWTSWSSNFGYNDDIWGQHIDSCGTMLWGSGGIKLIGHFESQFYQAMISDGAGGMIIAYHDSHFQGDGVEIIAQRFDGQGTRLWGEYGEWIGATWSLGDRRIVPDGRGGAVITWHHLMDGTHNAQRIGPDGMNEWGALGIDIGGRPAYTMCADGLGGMIMAWGDTAIAAAKIDSNGLFAWEHPVCEADGIQTNPRIITLGAGGSMIAWEDWRGGDCDIYATRIDTAGEKPTATLLRSFRVFAGRSVVTIEWRLSEIDEGARFFVMRSHAEVHAYEELIDPKIRKSDLLFTCVDAGCERGAAYVYRVDVFDGARRRTLFESEEVRLPPIAFELLQNYPNPFNPSTTIPFAVPEKAMVTVEIYTVAGERLARLVHEKRESGWYEARWDGNDARGIPASPGVYLCRLTAGKHTLSRKIVLLK